MQHEITKRDLLLDEWGNIKEPGYAKRQMLIYRRSGVKSGFLRLKEWDYYLIQNEHFAIALTIADNSYMGLDSISFINFDEKTEHTVSKMQWMTRGKKKFPMDSRYGSVKSKGKKYSIGFQKEKDKRILDFYMEDFYNDQILSGQIMLQDEPIESMVIATPFLKKGHFYYNQKINCLRAQGRFKLGKKEFEFSQTDSFGVLDWGRGVWTYSNTWYWGSASGLVNGVPFGFNIGYGFGNTENATENMIFYDGKAHKLNQVTFIIPSNTDLKGNIKEEYLSNWKFTSDDGRFEMDFQPILDRAAKTDIILISSDQHQVFGKFTGKAILDDGTVISIKDFIGFAEKVKNKW